MVIFNVLFPRLQKLLIERVTIFEYSFPIILTNQYI